MSKSLPPLHEPPAGGGKTSGCARAVVILILGVLLVSVLTYLTKKSPDVEETPDAVAEAPASPHEIKPIVDIPALAGQDSGEVMQVVGEQTSRQATENGPKEVYKDGLVEVVFIGRKADWITVTPKSDIPFDKNALAHFGIPAAEPTESNANVIRWEPCGDYVSVSIFPKDGNRVDYAYIKVATK